MNNGYFNNIINTISDKEFLKYAAFTGGVIIGGAVLDQTMAQQKTKTTDNTKKISLDDLKFDHKIIIDPTLQGMPNDPVKWECEPKMTIALDSTFYKLFNTKNRTPEQEKQLRDYLMELPNSVIISGRVVGVQPIFHFNPADNYALNLSSENTSSIKVYSSEEMFKMLRNNKDMSRADRRLLEQTIRSSYNRQLPDETRTLIEQAVADQYLLSSEQYDIAKSLQKFGLDGVLVGLVNTHQGGNYSGRRKNKSETQQKPTKVKGESVPYFGYFSANIPKDTVTVFVPDTTSRGYSGNSKPTGPVGKPKDKKKNYEVEEKSSLIRLNEAGIGIFYDSNGEIIPNMGIGVGLLNTNGQSIANFDMNIGYWKFRNDNIPGEEIVGSFGVTTINSGKITEDQFNIGASLTAGGDFKMGIGAEYFKHMTKIRQTFDEILRDHQGNIVKQRYNQNMPGTGDFKEDALMFGPAMKYNAQNVSFNAKALFGAHNKPAYYFGTSVRF